MYSAPTLSACKALTVRTLRAEIGTVGLKPLSNVIVSKASGALYTHAVNSSGGKRRTPSVRYEVDCVPCKAEASPASGN